jgi:hypothetical protein
VRRPPRHHGVVFPHHHPVGGASSSGISTTASWSTAVGTGAGGTPDEAVAAAVTATVTATSCRDPVASAAGHCGSLATAVLSSLDALDERRLVGTDVPDLSTLAGAWSGTIGAAL